MAEVTVAALEDYLRDHYGTRVSEQSLFMKLIEEVGEVAEVLNKRAGRKSAGEGDDLSQPLLDELVDIVHYVVAIAAVNQLDLAQAIVEKDQRASVKYGHDTNLLEFLEKRK